jgi:hypothetical protein
MSNEMTGAGGRAGQDRHRCFVIHLWFEPECHWRGRISDDKGDSVFEDGQSLLGFIQKRLLKEFKVTLPLRRSRP